MNMVNSMSIKEIIVIVLMVACPILAVWVLRKVRETQARIEGRTAKTGSGTTPPTTPSTGRFAWSWTERNMWACVPMVLLIYGLKAWVMWDRDELPYGEFVDRFFWWYLWVPPDPVYGGFFEAARAIVVSATSFGPIEVALFWWCLGIFGPAQLKWGWHILFWGGLTCVWAYFGPHWLIPCVLGGAGLVFAAPWDKGGDPAFRTWCNLFFWGACLWAFPLSYAFGWNWTTWVAQVQGLSP